MDGARKTFFMARKRSRIEVADIIHRVPAGLDAAHVGYNFINEMGIGHCSSLARGRVGVSIFGMATQQNTYATRHPGIVRFYDLGCGGKSDVR